jgi:tetratricopeptide (TPR) repeat protein
MSLPSTTRVAILLAALAALALVGAGCKEFNARRKVNEAGKLYEKGRFREAAALYEEALSEQPDLEIAHFNAGLTYRQLFTQAQSDPEVSEKEVKELANKSAGHFLAYLENHPGDASVVAMTTKLWIDSGQFELALDYWEGRRAKDPKNAEVLGILAGINRQAGNWEKAVEYHLIQSDLAASVDASASVLVDVAKIIWHKLADREKLLGMDRLRVADMGIATMQKADKMLQGATDPTDRRQLEARLKHKVDVASYTASFLNFRALAHPAVWARGVEEAAAQVQRAQWQVINDQWKKLKSELDAEDEAGTGGG